MPETDRPNQWPPIVPKNILQCLGNVMTLEPGCRNAVYMSSDCRSVSVCYPVGMSLSPELVCRRRLETGFIGLLADPSVTPAGRHIRFLSPLVMLADVLLSG